MIANDTARNLPHERPQSPRDRPTSRRERLALYVARLIAGRDILAAVTAQVDDSGGWHAFEGGPNDRDASEILQQYEDALEAWRKNPIAKRVIDLMTDFCLGDGFTPTASGQIGRFVDRFWNHPKNLMHLRLPDLSDELSRAGDLFLTLHRNPADGLSYLRPVPKDRILKIETLTNDWETEIAYHEAVDAGGSRRWLSPAHPASHDAQAIMLHYSVNRVVGALMGESDLATIIPWLLRYSRMVEDRVRLHWAARAFLWIVTVPTGKVQAKREQYRQPPEAGSVIVKDDSEAWDCVNPDLKGMDAQFDLRAVRQFIDAGSGMPPHWRGEPHDVSLATAEAMAKAASRHLRRRQLYLRHAAVDLCHTAYTRAHQIGKVRARPNRKAITIAIADIDRDDNRDLAQSARDLATALDILVTCLTQPDTPPTLGRLMLQAVLKFAGEPLDDDVLDTVMGEISETSS
jgi:hypothetical protein